MASARERAYRVACVSHSVLSRGCVFCHRPPAIGRAHAYLVVEAAAAAGGAAGCAAGVVLHADHRRREHGEPGVAHLCDQVYTECGSVGG